MICIVNVTAKENFDKDIHTYELRINNRVCFKFRHLRSDPLEVILQKASKAAKKYSDAELLEMIEVFSTNKMEVGSLTSFKKGNSDSYKNNAKNFKRNKK